MGCSDFSINDHDVRSTEAVVVEETFLQDPVPRVDLLWLIDNTASMASEQAYLAAHIEDFADRLDAAQVSWQMGALTPDGDGVLEGNPWVITPGNLSPFALASMFQPGTDGSQPSTGLSAIITALSSPRSIEDNRGFRRPDAALSVLIFADGDDQSDAILGPAPVDTYVDFLAAQADDTGLSAMTTAIVGPDPAGCTGVTGTATAGTRYSDAAQATGGQTLSICDPNLDAIADEIASQGVHLATSFELQAPPISGEVRVSVDQLRRDDGWWVTDTTLHFETAPTFGSTITVRYSVGEQ
jgi:hypothetical protein